MKNYKIAVAGTGYVGLSLGVLLSQHHQVVAVDIVQAKVDMINNKKSPIQDDYIEKYLAEKELNLTATLDAKAACMKAFHAKLTMSNEAMIFSLVKDDKEWNLEIPIIDVDLEELKQFLLGKICFLDFLCLAAFNMSVDINTIPTAEQFMDVFETWDKSCDYFYKIRIPQQIRKQLLAQLDAMGFRESSIYPDMEHIAKEQADSHFNF